MSHLVRYSKPNGASLVARMVKNLLAGKLSSIPTSGRSPGEGHGDPLQYSCLENLWAEEPGGLHTVHWVAKSWTRPSNYHTQQTQYLSGAASCLLTSASLESSSPETWPWLEQCGKRLFKKVFVEFAIMLLLLFMFWLLAIRPVRS